MAATAHAGYNLSWPFKSPQVMLKYDAVVCLQLWSIKANVTINEC